PLVGHEIKPVLVAQFAEDEGAEPTPIAFDTQIAAYILNAALRSQTIADVVDERLDRLFREVELPLIPVLARMESIGVALDREALALLEREFGAEINRLEQEI